MRSIPESSSLEQVDQYKQRDMTSSHLFRLGTGLFRNKGKICRHRIIDSAHEVHHNSRSGPVCGYNEATKAASHLHTTGTILWVTSIAQPHYCKQTFFP